MGVTYDDCLGDPAFWCSGGSIIGIHAPGPASGVYILDNVINNLVAGRGYDLHSPAIDAAGGGSATGMELGSGIDTCIISGNTLSRFCGGQGGLNVCGNCGVPGDGGNAVGISVLDGRDTLIASNRIEDGSAGDGGYWQSLLSGWDGYGAPGRFAGIAMTGSGEVSRNTIVTGEGGYPSADATGIAVTGQVDILENEVSGIRAAGGFHDYGGPAIGISLEGQPASAVRVMHNRVYSLVGGEAAGSARGILARAPSQITNNLVFDIQAGPAEVGGPHGEAAGVAVLDTDASVVNNTVSRVSTDTSAADYSNADGIYIRSAAGASAARNNIVAGISGVKAGADGGGFGIRAAGIEPAHSHNLAFACPEGSYEGFAAPDPTDLSDDPRFVSAGPDPSGFYLSQSSCGQGAESPAVDSGSDTAPALGLEDRTTCTTLAVDAGVVDRGYHYASSQSGGRFTIRRGERVPGTIRVIACVEALPFIDPEPVFGPGYAALLLYQVDEAPVVFLTRHMGRVRIE